jgi:hypothetical protein
MWKLIEAVDAMPENLRRRSNQGRNRMKSLVPTIALSILLGQPARTLRLRANER